ncbi:hypothetical protein CSOJ01_07386 [Colletotrichum sojae]|uniref:Uncharacterized protein n=1 Tax=Colletotrichum sojae TaxID=2175907 RepID=A0A8H6MTQ6_9PEZI|nr:hypothetical protein CSOJ01_07386 [Colletotrichum sojae]
MSPAAPFLAPPPPPPPADRCTSRTVSPTHRYIGRVCHGTGTMGRDTRPIISWSFPFIQAITTPCLHPRAPDCHSAGFRASRSSSSSSSSKHADAPQQRPPTRPPPPGPLTPTHRASVIRLSSPSVWVSPSQSRLTPPLPFPIAVASCRRSYDLQLLHRCDHAAVRRRPSHRALENRIHRERLPAIRTLPPRARHPLPLYRAAPGP